MVYNPCGRLLVLSVPFSSLRYLVPGASTCLSVIFDLSLAEARLQCLGRTQSIGAGFRPIILFPEYFCPPERALTEFSCIVRLPLSSLTIYSTREYIKTLRRNLAPSCKTSKTCTGQKPRHIEPPNCRVKASGSNQPVEAGNTGREEDRRQEGRDSARWETVPSH